MAVVPSALLALLAPLALLLALLLALPLLLPLEPHPPLQALLLPRARPAFLWPVGDSTHRCSARALSALVLWALDPGRPGLRAQGSTEIGAYYDRPPRR